ncbi:hypothetical protein F5Y17DRAFT_460991 [Xylariaceae sp. FL0594]|nr:hypothetical protein F5Y17DRAFT_460991 [Xylariaceae sp. FL0594]
MPSGTREANEKFQRAVEKTREPGASSSNFLASGPSGPASNSSIQGKATSSPKVGGGGLGQQHLNGGSGLARGDTEASGYDPGFFGGSSRG